MGAVLLIILANWVKMARNGVNPFTAEATVISKIVNSQALEPKKSIESRLLELGELLEKGKITAVEHHEARIKILAE